jgi:hypothetical protein
MTRPIGLRARRAGFSSLYGAFGVVLVSTLVIGIVLGSEGPEPQREGRERHLAGLFLDTLLKSSVGNATNFGDAVGAACIHSPCPEGGWNATRLSQAAARIAAPLARALDRAFAVQLSEGGATAFRVGDLPPTARASASQAEVYDRVEVGFVVVAVFLAAP